MEKYDPVESYILFYERSIGFWTTSSTNSLHIFEERKHWGGITFKKLSAIGDDGEGIFELERNGLKHELTNQQGKRVFND